MSRCDRARAVYERASLAHFERGQSAMRMTCFLLAMFLRLCMRRNLDPPRLVPLLAAGFTHTAFVFGAESSLVHSDIPGQEVPVGALVSFIQKGCQFAELEANLTDVRGRLGREGARRP